MIPAKRPSQIETLRFDLKRRSHRAIRSFRSITVLRKRSERRVLRRGPPEATGQGNETQTQAANPQKPGGLPAAAGTRVWTRVVSLLRERPSFAARRKKAKARPREPISRRFPWESLPDDQGGSAPIGFPTFGRETKVLRGTKEERYLTQAGRGNPFPCPKSAYHSAFPALLERPAPGRFPFSLPRKIPAVTL